MPAIGFPKPLMGSDNAVDRLDETVPIETVQEIKNDVPGPNGSKMVEIGAL